MPNYEVRNLVLAIVDDDEEKDWAAPFGLVSLVEFPPTEISQISTLHVHCRNAAVEKRLWFDLASIDINFQQDGEDPMHPRSALEVESATEAKKGVAHPSVMTASGLYHGMALLARRSAVDEEGNVLPLAWEVRSAAPKAFGSRADLRNDAVRGYALLRSLLASPADGESLEDCIRREYAIANPTSEPLRARTLLELMESDLLGQESSSGYITDILSTLLVKWRRLFRAAVKQRDVVLHKTVMRRHLRVLEKLSCNKRVRVSELESLCVPLQGTRDREIAGGIRLSSIMADFVVNGKINVIEPTARMGVDGQEISILDWYKGLLEIAQGIPSWAELFQSTRVRFEKTVSQSPCHEKAVADLWLNSGGEDMNRYNEQFFLYLLMRVRLWMTGEYAEMRNPVDYKDLYPYGDPDEDPRDKKYSNSYCMSKHYGLDPNLTIHSNTFFRPMQGNQILSARPTVLREGLVRALDSKDGLLVRAGIWHEWLADELRKYCTDKPPNGLGMKESEVYKMAKGLSP